MKSEKVQYDLESEITRILSNPEFLHYVNAELSRREHLGITNLTLEQVIALINTAVSRSLEHSSTQMDQST
jgi:hypothetical protein